MADNDNTDDPIFTNTSNPTTETTATVADANNADNPTTETTETETATVADANNNNLDLLDFDFPKKNLINKYDSLYTLSKVQTEIEKILK